MSLWKKKNTDGTTIMYTYDDKSNNIAELNHHFSASKDEQRTEKRDVVHCSNSKPPRPHTESKRKEAKNGRQYIQFNSIHDNVPFRKEK